MFLLSSFSAFCDLVDLTYWGCLHFRFLYSLTLFDLCFFHFSSILLASLVIRKRVAMFFNWIFSRYFRYLSNLRRKYGGSNSSRAVFLNRRAAARYRALASIIPGRERSEETTICYKILLVQLIINLNVILYLSTCHTLYISVLILFMIMP